MDKDAQPTMGKTLWESVQNHSSDKDFWHRFYAWYQPKVYRFALQQLPNNRAAADLVTQDLFMRLFENVSDETKTLYLVQGSLECFIRHTLQWVIAEYRRDYGQPDPGEPSSTNATEHSSPDNPDQPQKRKRNRARRPSCIGSADLDQMSTNEFSEGVVAVVGAAEEMARDCKKWAEAYRTAVPQYKRDSQFDQRSWDIFLAIDGHDESGADLDREEIAGRDPCPKPRRRSNAATTAWRFRVRLAKLMNLPFNTEEERERAKCIVKYCALSIGDVSEPERTGTVQQGRTSS